MFLIMELPYFRASPPTSRLLTIFPPGSEEGLAIKHLLSLQKIAKGFNTILREDYLESADIKQYVPILLEKFKQKGVAMCITTSTDKAIADEILVRLGIRDYFTFIMTCEEAGGDKESPKVFLDAHKKLGTPKDETIVVEDGLLAIRGAKEADFYVIAVADKNEEQNKAEIQELSDRYIESFEELL